jgi:2-dehydro-3-deoxyphosphogluconate aldolase/(4S)-4-hydroxy-2-oxoglutarate aldolase
MTIEELVSGLERVRLVAIIRLHDHSDVVEIAETLVSAGIEYLEVTIERATGLDALQRVANACATTVTVGAGTVVRPEDVARAADSGARFIVTPNVNPDVIAAAHEQGLMILPGAFTPSEVAVAAQCGAHFVKLFPASTGGLGHLTALRGPFPQVRLVPTGGVTSDNAHEWLDAGAAAVAMGSNLVPVNGSLDGMYERTRRAVAGCRR